MKLKLTNINVGGRRQIERELQLPTDLNAMRLVLSMAGYTDLTDDEVIGAYVRTHLFYFEKVEYNTIDETNVVKLVQDNMEYLSKALIESTVSDFYLEQPAAASLLTTDFKETVKRKVRISFPAAFMLARPFDEEGDAIRPLEISLAMLYYLPLKIEVM